MKLFITIVLLVCNALLCHAGGRDSVSTTANTRKLFSKHKREEPSPLIEKMSDDQLLRLIDHMFEATYMPPDLWSQVMMETAKRNLSKINTLDFNDDMPCELASGKLHIEKLMPELVEPANLRDMAFLRPASVYYDEWDVDLSNLFKDQFAADTSYTLELENSEFGCYNMPSWGPLSSPFGWRHNRYHKGVDIQLRKGDSVTCAFDGVVRFSQKKGGYGNVVIVRHYNGLETVYAHLYKIKVKEGQVIGAGELVGLAGSTGHSTGPHLHFEIRFMGAPVNPQYFISFDYGNLLFNTIVFKKNKSGFLSAYNPSTEFHTIEKGETLMDIANRYCTSTLKLRAMNGMSPKQYFRLKKGMVLRVREIDHSESASSK